MARAGVASRRECENLIEQGRVRVDGRTVREPGTFVDATSMKIECDGSRVRPEKKVYYLLNKPRGVICSNADELGRTGAVALLGDLPYKLNTVGRLDKDSEGLIIVTNDGKLTNLLTHPRYQVCKTYHVLVSGRLTAEDLSLLRKGVHLAEGPVRPSSVRVDGSSDRETWLEIELKEGQNREIRRMLAATGHTVRRLERVAIGPVSDSHLKPGHFRKLAPEEVSVLFREAQGSRKPKQEDGQ